MEFGALTDDQRTCIDLHSLRAVGSDHDELSDSGDFVFEFWLPDGDTAQTVFDDIRGWAIGSGLPVRRLVSESTRADTRARQLLELRAEVERLVADGLASDRRHAVELAQRNADHEADSQRREADYAAKLDDRDEREAASEVRHAAELHQRDLHHAADIDRRNVEHVAELDHRDADHAADTDRRNAEHAAELHVHDEQHDIDIANLTRALASRDLIGQAKGIIMATMQCTPDGAFEILKRQSQAENVKVADIAAEIVDRVARRARMD